MAAKPVAGSLSSGRDKCVSCTVWTQSHRRSSILPVEFIISQVTWQLQSLLVLFPSSPSTASPHLDPRSPSSPPRIQPRDQDGVLLVLCMAGCCSHILLLWPQVSVMLPVGESPFQPYLLLLYPPYLDIAIHLDCVFLTLMDHCFLISQCSLWAVKSNAADADHRKQPLPLISSYIQHVKGSPLYNTSPGH